MLRPILLSSSEQLLLLSVFQFCLMLNPCVTLTRDSKRQSLVARTRTYAILVTGKPFLSCAQASRRVRNGCESYLVRVNSVLAASLTDTSPSDAVDVTDKLSCDIASLKDRYL